jgi:hypothetical protein
LASDQSPEDEQPRPQTLIMLTGLYLFLLLVSIGSYGQPIALFGLMLEDTAARAFIAINSIYCLYLFLGLWQRQRLTWYLLLAYNLFEIANTLATLVWLPRQELERVLGMPVDPLWLTVNNLGTVAAIAWVSHLVYRRRELFSNRSPYLFFNS